MLLVAVARLGQNFTMTTQDKRSKEELVAITITKAPLASATHANGQVEGDSFY
jgi:hypothetical protein